LTILRSLCIYVDSFPSLDFAGFKPRNADFKRPSAHIAGMASTTHNQSQRPSPSARPPPARPPPARPLPQDATDNGNRYTLVQRVQCLTLIVEGRSVVYIEQKTGVKKRTQNYIRKRAFDRGFNPDEDSRILKSYVVDSNRSGRPKEISVEQEERLLLAVRKDRSGREKSSEVLTYESNMSYSSALRILHKYRLSCVKPTIKSGLIPIMKKIRLEWCLAHEYWTLEDWKNVIWTDETSVIFGHR
jgi:hypothetical protein